MIYGEASYYNIILLYMLQLLHKNPYFGTVCKTALYMKYYLRFLCYDDLSRRTTTQIHPDIVVPEPPRFGYGQGVRVGDDADDPFSWPQYVVANITHAKQEDDPANSGTNALVFQVFLARYEEWTQFSLPEMVLEAMRNEGE
ncbi:hypothetical protein GCM10028825_07830 [Spirosoma agri]